MHSVHQMQTQMDSQAQCANTLARTRARKQLHAHATPRNSTSQHILTCSEESGMKQNTLWVAVISPGTWLNSNNNTDRARFLCRPASCQSIYYHTSELHQLWKGPHTVQPISLRPVSLHLYISPGVLYKFNQIPKPGLVFPLLFVMIISVLGDRDLVILTNDFSRAALLACQNKHSPCNVFCFPDVYEIVEIIWEPVNIVTA